MNLASDQQRKKLLTDLEERLRHSEARGKWYDEKYATAAKTVNSLKAGIEQMFQTIGCANTATAELLGNAGVTESNMMQYLGIIEQRVNQLLAAYSSQHKSDNKDQKHGIDSKMPEPDPNTHHDEDATTQSTNPSAQKHADLLPALESVNQQTLETEKKTNSSLKDIQKSII